MLRHLTAACLAAFLALGFAGRAAAGPPEKCPYRPGPCDRQGQAAEVATLPSVLDNLNALEKAASEIDAALALGQAGQTAEAIEHLKKARQLCPGSSMARRAEEALQGLAA